MDNPIIFVTSDNLPNIVDEAEQHLIAAPHLGIYQRDGKLVRIGKLPQHGMKPALEFMPIVANTLVELLTTIITWQRQEGKKIVNTACPDRVAATYLARTGHWRLPHIRSIITAPTMRPDGSIISAPGYDSATSLFYHPQGVDFPTIPDHPSREQARECLDTIIGMVDEVPFVEDEFGRGNVSRSVFLSAVLSAVIRPILPAVPIHGFSSPTPGTGKSILVNAIAYLLTGRPCSPLADSGNSEETAKQLSSALQAGYAVISFDNVSEPLGSSILCQALSEPVLSVRVYGKTELKQITNTAMYCATGNNLIFTGDIIRRALRCMIDGKCEQPHTRAFKSTRPDLAFRDNRIELVTAALTILRAFWSAGLPSSGLQPIGTFEEWSGKVRNCLVWLGEPDPWLVSEQLRGEDPAIANNIAAMEAWFEKLQDDKVTTKQVVDLAFEKFDQPGRGLVYRCPKLNDALRTVTDGNLSSRVLGCWLRSIKDRPFGGFTVNQATIQAGNNRWQIVRDGDAMPSEKPIFD
jgi:putative DNA primase/helicase